MTHKVIHSQKQPDLLLPVPHNDKKKRRIHIPINALQGVILCLFLVVVFVVGSFLRYHQNTQNNSSSVNTEKTALETQPQITNVQLKQFEKLASTPSIWPVSGTITSPFGWRNSPFGTGNVFHSGIDIANNMGIPVFATADGEVIHGGWSDGYGNLVQLDHKNGISTLYGHNSQIIVHIGQFVKKGQIISLLGSTGNSTGPHVHYEVRVNGTAVNPENFLVLK